MNEHPDLTKALEKRQDISRYSRWIYNNIRPFIKIRVLDIGSGTGNMVRFFFEEDLEIIAATDIFESQIETMKKRFGDKKNFFPFLFDISRDDCSALAEYGFDTITCINVLEHIEDDLLALVRMKEIIEHKGRIVLLVPALSWIFGTMDKACGHCRRYDRHDMDRLARKAGLEIIYKQFMNPMGIIPWFIKGRILRKMSTFSETLDKRSSFIINAVSAVLEKGEKIIRPPAGISQITVMEKP